MIPGVCPDCGCARPLSDYLADADARAALAAALECPAPLARLIPPYLALHAPAGRRVQMGKLARTIRELADLVQAGTVTRARETLPAPLAAWQRGLEEVLAARDAGTLSLPLSGHGYLCEVVHRQARAAGARSARETAPNHPSHRPFDAAPGQTEADIRADKARALSDYRSTERLLRDAAGPARLALGAQLAAQRRRLAALGIALPAAAGESADTDPAPDTATEDPADDC